MSNGRSIGRYAAREADEKAALYDAALLRRLWRYLRPYSGLAAASLALLMLNSALGVSWPLLTQVAVDRYLKPDPTAESLLDPLLPASPVEGILWILAIYLAVLTLSSLTRAAQIQTMNFTGQRVMRDIRREIFGHLQKLPVAYFDRTPSGRLVTRATSDVDVLNELFTSGLVAVAGDILTLVCAFGAMAYLSPSLTLVYLAVAPLVLVVSFVFRRFARKSFRDVRHAVAKLASFLQECFAGITEVQLFNHERQAVRDFDAINEEHRRANYRAIRAHAVFFPLVEWLNYLGLALLVVLGGAWVVDGSVSLGVLLAFLQYGTRVFRPIQDLAEKYNILQAAMAGAERIFELLDTRPPDLSRPAAPCRELEVPSVEFRNVWFAYKDENWVLKDVSFEVEPGEMLAVVGHTGAGKSTLVNLLLRFYEIQRGAILVGGRDIGDWDPEALRAQFSVVLQDPCLLAGSIAENIGLNDEAVTNESIRRAASNANLARHVESRPRQYDEEVLERGGGLSSGQKQLVAFARALVRERPFLVLDEATSSVDPDTERDIRDTLSKLLTGRTSIVIAHRLSTIRRARRILVLHRGRVQESGTHEELLAAGGVYSRLHKLQSLFEAVQAR
ncbi:MAG: ABC transporter ATP-binding protein [Bryobacterales bacterium]|nr:ABC transporter ATP-binding protein [Bryobacterales bacterium]